MCNTFHSVQGKKVGLEKGLGCCGNNIKRKLFGIRTDSSVLVNLHSHEILRSTHVSLDIIV